MQELHDAASVCWRWHALCTAVGDDRCRVLALLPPYHPIHPPVVLPHCLNSQTKRHLQIHITQMAEPVVLVLVLAVWDTRM